MKQRLLDKLVKTLPAPARSNRIVYDTEVPGFGIRITKAGTKAFILNYHSRGLERRYTIGRYPAWTVVAAREEAKRLRRDVDQGRDPLQQRQEDREAPTVRDLWEQYKKVHLPKLAERSARDQSSMWESYILPMLGSRKLADVTSADTDSLHREITARAPIRANRVLEVVRKAFNMGKRWGWCSHNPADGFQRNREQPKERFLTEEEIQLVLEHLDRMANQKAANAIRLMILTGARRGEVLNAEWSHFDLQQGLWTKPAAFTKARREHRVVLSVEAIQLLAAMKERAEGAYLFPSANGNPIPDLKRPWAWLVRETGLEGLRIHDLRHTFASILASAGISLPVIGKLLGHSQHQTTMRYIGLLDEPLRTATGKMGRIVAGGGK